MPKEPIWVGKTKFMNPADSFKQDNHKTGLVILKAMMFIQWELLSLNCFLLTSPTLIGILKVSFLLLSLDSNKKSKSRELS